MKKKPLLMTTAALLLAVSLGSPAAWATPAAAAAAADKALATGNFREIKWDELVPKGWDPLKQFREMNLGAMNDGDPRTNAMLKQMRETWDNAPTNGDLDGAAVRLPGYLVPLEEIKGEVKEFLLVPYMGACIHSPPPPANQIIHVKMAKPAKGLRMMDAIWVNGILKTQRLDTVMGVSGYRMETASAELYQPPKNR